MKAAKRILIGAAVLLALYFMPFITVQSADNANRTWRVPFGTWFTGATENSVTFSGIRSSYALAKDSENALHSGEEIKCYGKTYYYLKDSDISLVGYQTADGIPASVTFTYQNGNACKGWTSDDEVAWELGAIEDAELSIDPQKAADDLQWFVIVDGVALNPGIYNDFSRLVKQGVFSILRTMIVENGEAKLVDIQLLENPEKQKIGDNEQEAYYRVATRTGKDVSEAFYTRYSETAEVTPRTVSVYEKDAEGMEHEKKLFTYKIN